MGSSSNRIVASLLRFEGGSFFKVDFFFYPFGFEERKTLQCCNYIF